jgi:hypothetical protein
MDLQISLCGYILLQESDEVTETTNLSMLLDLGMLSLDSDIAQQVNSDLLLDLCLPAAIFKAYGVKE